MIFGLDIPALARRIMELQEPSGRIWWVDGGLFDPWNHCEASMGLAAAGEIEAARRALDHLAECQRADGAWMADMGCAVPLDADNRKLVTDRPAQVVDTNFCAYPALAAWHLAKATGSTRELARHAAMVRRALDFVLDNQADTGEIAWREVEPGESVHGVGALIAGSASIYQSLEAGVRIETALGRPSDHLARARAKLGCALRERPDRFKPKSRYAMDWYYPALTGVLSHVAARARLSAHWEEFVEPHWGCRCVDDEPWATAAETAELALACARAGARLAAASLVRSLARHASRDGGLWMGRQFVEDIFWPEERPSWTAGAAILAVDAVTRRSTASGVFLERLPETRAPADAAVSRTGPVSETA